MEREIWEIVKVLDEGKLTAIEAHKKLCDIHVVSNCISDAGLRELYRKAYNDGFENKADKKEATDLIDKRIDRIKKNYGC